MVAAANLVEVAALVGDTGEIGGTDNAVRCHYSAGYLSSPRV
jgi:hypothetical protein